MTRYNGHAKAYTLDLCLSRPRKSTEMLYLWITVILNYIYSVIHLQGQSHIIGNGTSLDMCILTENAIPAKKLRVTHMDQNSFRKKVFFLIFPRKESDKDCHQLCCFKYFVETHCLNEVYKMILNTEAVIKNLILLLHSTTLYFDTFMTQILKIHE